jgi:glycosyltransferase involved in cell wall biosynthesis
MTPKVLFITWDGPQTSYMEGLFMPIFQEIMKNYPVEFHVMQFTWGDTQRVGITKTAAEKMGIRYTAVNILRKPIALLGSLFSLYTGSKKISRYIKEHQIDIVMPRSNFPAFMLNKISDKKFKVIFDADGLPIEERVDFSGLSKSSRQYKWLKKQEKIILLRADKVITRSQKSIELHLENIGEPFRHKFSVVYNGRDVDFFKPDPVKRSVKRTELGFAEQDKVFIYSGSLGPQYGWEEMLAIFSEYQKKHDAKWLILTGDIQFAQERITKDLNNKIIVKKLPFNDVPDYLNVADVAFAIRQPALSMQGVSPIKLGEYLLMELPVIASKGIGDTEAVIKDVDGCFIYDHDHEGLVKKAVSWLETLQLGNKEKIREQGLSYFSLKAASQSYLKVLKSL